MESSMLSMRILDVLNYVERKSDELSIPRIGRDDGIALYSILYMLTHGKSDFVAIDAGAGIGYSTIWLLAALENSYTKSRLYAIEWNRERFEILKEVLNAVPKNRTDVSTVYGDALKYVRSNFSENAIDFIFIDIDKDIYVEMFDIVKKRIRENGVVVYHNAYMARRTIISIIKRASEEGWASTVIPTNEGLLLLRPPIKYVEKMV
ncbi:MAG: class I SAM-dependent methyltransferase [Ignisphaera sp.]